MKKQFLSVILISVIIAILLSKSLESKVYSITELEQDYQIEHVKGCQDGKDDKNPDPTQYDKVGGFSKHAVDYNTGYVDGYNACSSSQQMDPLID